jgi:protocatechuate 3,4-dioxygenase beta subunit
MSLDDDRQVGRILTRREALTLLGAAGAAVVAGGPTFLDAQAAPCVVVPEQAQGPYFVDARLNRTDIRTDPGDGAARQGVPLRLSLNVSDIGASGACAPLAGALVDIWQCDAIGIYSDFQDSRGGFDARGKKFLRGYQTTDRNGRVDFTTIYPGWYPGRAVHIHFKIRTNPAGARGADFTSQLYFDEAVTDRVHAQAPYATKGRRPMMNEADSLFRKGGSQLMLRLVEVSGGYAGAFDVAMRKPA